MKILIIHCAYKYMGGENTVVEEEMKLLKSAGNMISLLQFSNQSNELVKLLQLPFNLLSYLKTARAVNVFRPDVVHVHNLHFAGSASVIYAIKRKNVPVVLTLHNFRLLCPSGTLFFNGRLFLDSLKQTFYWMAIKKGVYKNSRLLTLWLSVSMQLHQWLRTWKIPSRYIVLSNHARELFLQSKLGLKEKQMVVKPNFSSLPVTSNHFERKTHFLFIGRLSIEKGIVLLLETFGTNHNYELHIAGDGPYRESVIRYSKNFSNIRYLGLLNKELIQSELQLCTALVFPSIWYEGMPLTIIESFSCGTPVIASKLGAMQSMIQDGYNGLHFDPNDAIGLGRQLKKWMLLDEKEKVLFRKNALETYHQYYTPDKNREQLVAIYHTAINEINQIKSNK